MQSLTITRASEFPFTDDELIALAWDFRVQLIGERGMSFGMGSTIAAPLASHLNDHGLDVELCESDHSDLPNSPWHEHYWIALPDGRVLDPTYDQFFEEEPEPVYIGKATEFHQ